MIQGDRNDFLARLAATQSGLSPQAERVAVFVAQQYVRAAFMSTRELAAAAGVSVATVVRFPALLGYPSFAAFRTAIQDRVNFDLSGVERLRALPAGNRSPVALLRRIVETDVASLRGLAHTFSEPQFIRFVDIVIEARRVTILGFRYVGPLALYFRYSLTKIKPGVEGLTRADSTLYDRVRLMAGDDLIVAIAFARYPADLLAVARYAHKLGVRLLAITDSPLSPLLPLAEVALLAKAGMLDFVGSLAAPAALINCIVSEIGVRLGDKAVERLQAIEDSASDAGIYVPGGGHGTASRRSGLLAWDDPQVEDDGPGQPARTRRR